MIYKTNFYYIIKEESKYEIFPICDLTLDKITAINDKYNLKSCIAVNDKTKVNFDLTRKDVIYIHYKEAADRSFIVKHPVKDMFNDYVQKTEELSSEELISLLYDYNMFKSDIVNQSQIDIKIVYYIYEILENTEKMAALTSQLKDVFELRDNYDIGQYMNDKEESDKIKKHNSSVNAEVEKCERTIYDNITSLRRIVDDGIKIKMTINDCKLSFMLLTDNKIEINEL